MEIKETKFELDLKVYFPEIYNLNKFSKFDSKIWKVTEAMIKMIEENAYGEIKITYQNGKINHVFVTKSID